MNLIIIKVYDELIEEKPEMADQKKNVILLKRLKAQLRLLLKENPILPSFKYKGRDLLDEVKSEL